MGDGHVDTRIDRATLAAAAEIGLSMSGRRQALRLAHTTGAVPVEWLAEQAAALGKPFDSAAWTVDTSVQVETRTYRDKRAFDGDVARRLADGWVLASSSAPSDGRVTATRALTIGVFALGARKGRGRITATWTRGGNDK